MNGQDICFSSSAVEMEALETFCSGVVLPGFFVKPCLDGSQKALGRENIG